MGRRLRQKPERRSRRCLVGDILVVLGFMAIMLWVIRSWIPAIGRLLLRALIFGALVVAAMLQKGSKG